MSQNKNVPFTDYMRTPGTSRSSVAETGGEVKQIFLPMSLTMWILLNI